MEAGRRGRILAKPPNGRAASLFSDQKKTRRAKPASWKKRIGYFWRFLVQWTAYLTSSV